jgi:hypothetical protein
VISIGYHPSPFPLPSREGDLETLSPGGRAEGEGEHESEISDLKLAPMPPYSPFLKGDTGGFVVAPVLPYTGRNDILWSPVTDGLL